MLPTARALKTFREARGLSLHALGRRAGVTHVTLLKIERGDVDPRLGTLKALAAALGVRLVDLLADEDRPARARGPARRRARG